MCLSIALDRPNDVLASGEHAGHEWMVIHNQQGYRCGYVKVQSGHPWHGKGYGDIDVECHGGLTFVRHDVKCDKGGEDSGYWVGFDCMHGGDASDPTLPAEFEHRREHGIIRAQEYVENECRSLCEQAARAMSERVADDRR